MFYNLPHPKPAVVAIFFTLLWLIACSPESGTPQTDASSKNQASGVDSSTAEQTNLGANQVAEREVKTSPIPQAPFIDVTNDSGIDFVHNQDASENFYMPEIMGSGVALFDIDNDGDLDVYFVQGGSLREGGADRVFRNELIPPTTQNTDSTDPSKSLTFTDITESAGIPNQAYGMGIATGDIDGDGFVDLYVTNFGANFLLKNSGDGTFNDIAKAAGVDDQRWSVPAAFFDINADDKPDLYVGNYVDFRIANHKDCLSTTGLPDYCSPHSYGFVPDRLFLNQGNGQFTDISTSSGVRNAPSKSLGVISGDFNDDQLTDFYVANDGVANQLWINLGDNKFEDNALLAGCALNYAGLAEAGMGVDTADIDNDGDEDLFMTHLNGETNTLYLNRGDASFEDQTIHFGLAAASIPLTGFGTAWIDVDNDGRLDLFTANGAVTAEQKLVQAGDDYPFDQRNALFRNTGDRSTIHFEQYAANKDNPFSIKAVSRGAAFGDIDNDGDTDIVIANNGGKARVLLNTSGQDNAWLGLSLRHSQNSSDALGATAFVTLDDTTTLMRRVRTSGSYASANDPRLLFGLNQSSNEREVSVHWNDGTVENFGPLALRKYHTLVRGQGHNNEAVPQ